MMRFDGICVLCLASCLGCATSPEGTAMVPHRPIEVVEEISQPLSNLSAQRVFTAMSQLVALTINDGDALAGASAGRRSHERRRPWRYQSRRRDHLLVPRAVIAISQLPL
jgi:hypothetical protein